MKDYRLVVELQKLKVIEGRTGFGYETITGFTTEHTEEDLAKEMGGVNDGR